MRGLVISCPDCCVNTLTRLVSEKAYEPVFWFRLKVFTQSVGRLKSCCSHAPRALQKDNKKRREEGWKNTYFAIFVSATTAAITFFSQASEPFLNVFILGKNVWLDQSGLDSAESWSNRTRHLALRPNNPLFLDVQPPRPRSRLHRSWDRADCQTP